MKVQVRYIDRDGNVILTAPQDIETAKDIAQFYFGQGCEIISFVLV